MYIIVSFTVNKLRANTISSHVNVVTSCPWKLR